MPSMNWWPTLSESNRTKYWNLYHCYCSWIQVAHLSKVFIWGNYKLKGCIETLDCLFYLNANLQKSNNFYKLLLEYWTYEQKPSLLAPEETTTVNSIISPAVSSTWMYKIVILTFIMTSQSMGMHIVSMLVLKFFSLSICFYHE